MERQPLTAILFLPLFLSAAQTGFDENPRVFPGAHGFGIRTPAGRGGRLLKVTNLNSEGLGSLREALAARGPRIVVFEVGGVLDLQGKDLEVAEPFLTVAGQTAPSPGITLIRGSVSIKTHDVLVRHLRVRPGSSGGARRGEPEAAIALAGPDVNNIVVDHCSLSWAADENLLVAGARNGRTAPRNITLSSSIVAEALSESGQGRRSQAMGMLVDDDSTNIAVLGNLYAHNDQGNPAFKANSTGVVANNVIYNPGHSAIQVDWPANEWSGRPAPHNPRISVVGNLLLYGANTADGLALISRKGDVWLGDNLAYDVSGTPAAITAGLINVLNEKPVWPRGFLPVAASKTLDSVFHHAGARPRDRDDVDKRILADVRERKGRLIATQDEAGGYPRQAMTRRRLMVPPEDLDEWLAKMAADVE